jgi:hypothetical protein
MSENKNAKTPADDGHVAHVYLFEKTGRPMVAWDNAKDIKLGDRLYAAQKREWVGLTDEERSYYLQSASNVGWWQAAKMIEAKLKEKNT